MLPKNPKAISLDKIIILLTSSASVNQSQPSCQFPDLIQEELLAPGVNLEKRPLAAPSGDRGEKKVVPMTNQHQRQAEPVSTAHAVALINSDRASDVPEV